MAGSANLGGKNTRKRVIIASILAVVAIGLIVGTYLWRKGKLETGADVEQKLDLEEEQEFNADDDEAALTDGNEWRVGEGRVALRSGTLVKMDNESSIYLIYRGKKQHITNPQVFVQLGLKWENILVLPSSGYPNYLKLYQDGAKIEQFNAKKLPNGLTVKFSDGPTVYSVWNNKLKSYQSPTVFLTRHSWAEISVLGPENRQMPFDVVPFRYRGGNIVKPQDKAQVYWVAGAKKFPIDSPAEMERWGLKWENMIIAEPGILESRNPEATNKMMYEAGRKTSQISRNFLPMYLWKNPKNPTVFLFKYDNGARDLRFNGPEVFLNRFSWGEISYQHPKRTKPETPIPSASDLVSPSPSKSPSKSVSSSPSSSPTPSGWQPIP